MGKEGVVFKSEESWSTFIELPGHALQSVSPILPLPFLLAFFFFPYTEDLLWRIVSSSCEREMLAARRYKNIKKNKHFKFRLIPVQAFL